MTKESDSSVSRHVDYLVLKCILILFIGVSVIGANYASAQLPSIFPPPPTSSDIGSSNNSAPATNDITKPEIEILTTDLKEGKNVITVRVIDESFLQTRQVKYVEEGRIKLTDLARDHGNVYHALINVRPPTSIIEIEVIDSAGNRAEITKELPVSAASYASDPLSFLIMLWNNVTSFLGLSDSWK